MKMPLNVSESTRRRNPALYGPSPAQDCPTTSVSAPVKGEAAKKRLRQDPKPLMNALESEFYSLIKDKYPNSPPVRPQAKRYRLGNGLTYTPDFTCSYWYGYCPPMETAWEVKGKHSWDDSIAKLKAAAAIWTEVRFILVWKENGQWKNQIVLP